ncbi:unnamed protein product [Citrullus colocynthis]|uniref:Uncharacterized protein n=1 Tax=Citrullus colocynthis TaxID=252529 RepID=A0ABP0YBM4_9ROSI
MLLVEKALRIDAPDEDRNKKNIMNSRLLSFNLQLGIIAENDQCQQRSSSPSETSIPNPSPMKSTTESAYVKKNPDAYEVRSGTCPIGTPAFTNLLNQVTSIKMDRHNFLLCQNIALPIFGATNLDSSLELERQGPWWRFIQANLLELWKWHILSQPKQELQQ